MRTPILFLVGAVGIWFAYSVIVQCIAPDITAVVVAKVFGQ